MEAFFTPPLLAESFGGIDVLAERVTASQRAGHPGSFKLSRTPKKTGLIVMFVRKGIICRYIFGSDSRLELALRHASAVCSRPGTPYLSLGIDVDDDRFKVTVTFDQERGYSLRTEKQSGIASDLSLPFAKGEVGKMPPAAIRSFALEAGILASWSVMTMMALGRGGDAALAEIVDHERHLCRDGRQALDSAATRFDLGVGSGVTALALPSCRLHGGDV